MSPRHTPASDVSLTHPDRLYWPDEGVTKQALADYYAAVWPFMISNIRLRIDISPSQSYAAPCLAPSNELIVGLE